MSWLQDLAGKAENILNKIDQNAATVLHQKTDNQAKEEQNLLMEVRCEKAAGNPLLGISVSPKNMLSLKRSASTNTLKAQNDTNKSQMSTSWHTDSNSQSNGSVNEKRANKSQSNSTSRRSSFSSRADGVTVIENELSNGMATTVRATKINGGDSVEQELAALKIVLSEIKAERDEAKEELDLLREQVKAANSRSIIKELEEICVQLREDNEELNQKYDSLEKSNFNYIKSISDLETRLSKLHQSETDLRAKMEWAKQESEQANYELQQYRARAQSTLQMKDKLIEQLKSDGDSHHSNVTSGSNMHSIEIEQLKTEKSGLLDEIRIQNDQLEQIRRYVDRLEAVQKEQQNEFDVKLTGVNDDLRNEERKWRQYEADNKVQMRELAMVREEMARLQAESANKIHEKESELTKLRSQISPRPTSIGSANDLEQRVQSLTQSLVQKQNSLESVTADRNALRLQMEKLENQHRQTMVQLRQQRPQVINVNDTDDAKAQVPMFLQENPFDTGVARRVKRVYSTLDSMGVRLGVFLRRYPLIRILTIFYVVLLHLWVMVVLCSSTPN